MQSKQQNVIYLLSFLSGFLSLGIEVIWVRIASFAGHSVPQAFSFILAFFLLGIAIGAWFGKKICKSQPVTAVLVGRCFLLASIVDLVLLACAYAMMSSISFVYIMALFVLLGASVRGLVFPLVHHLGTESSKSGKQISNVYFANVLGSSLSPIIIGFVALDFMSTQQLYFLICVVSAMVFLLCQWSEKQRYIALSAVASMMAVIATYGMMLPEKLFHRLSEQGAGVDIPIVHLVENKHGFIQVYEEKNARGVDKVVYGANVYDGKFNTDLFHNINGIDRAYLLPVLQPTAKKVLVIGLSTGSWAKVLSSMPEMESMTIIEINPAYTDLIRNEPEVAGLLQDKRVSIIVDDGRKWLRKHPDEKFDLILMNTTWYWRAYSTNLLSADFLNIVKPHLNPNAVLMYNTTASEHAFTTALSVLPNVYRYKNMVISSPSPLALPDDETLKRRLARLQWSNNNHAVFVGEEQLDRALQEIKQNPFLHLTEPKPNTEIITDNNMITEFKYGNGL